jgi:hypothetical protein
MKAAMQDVVGDGYRFRLRTIRYDRMKPQDYRFQLESQLASQAVKARTSHMRWHTSAAAVEKAHQSKDVDKLVKTLAKWGSSCEDPRVKQARASLSRWQARAAKWLPRAREAMNSVDMPELYKSVKVLEKCPLDAASSEVRAAAKSLIAAYELQTKTLRRAIDTCDASSRIRTFLRDWEFDVADDVVIDANIFLMKRQDIAGELRAAIVDKEFTRSSSRLETAMKRFIEVFPNERMQRLNKRRSLGLMVKPSEADELDDMAKLLRSGLASLSTINADTECLSEVQIDADSETASQEFNMPFPFEGANASDGEEEIAEDASDAGFVLETEANESGRHMEDKHVLAMEASEMSINLEPGEMTEGDSEAFVQQVGCDGGTALVPAVTNLKEVKD